MITLNSSLHNSKNEDIIGKKDFLIITSKIMTYYVSDNSLSVCRKL